MEWVEVTGKTLAEAKDKALDYLGVDEAQAEFEVLEEPRVGLFRRVKGEARVRARIKPSHPRPKAERRDRKRRPAREGAAPRGEARPDRPAGGRGDRPAAGRDRSGAGGAKASGTSGGERRRSPATEAAEKPAGAAETPDVPTSPTVAVPAVTPQPVPASREPVNREEPLSAMTEDDRNEGSDDGRQTEHAVDFLTGLVATFGLPAKVASVTVDENYDEVQITGNDLGILIGPRAAALDSIQELTRVVAQRRSGGRGESRLRVDIGGYRQRRREALERFAIKLAEEVKASGKTKALEPMNSADRKVVHDIVGTLDGVSTLSEGEDPRRRVVIVPGS